MEYYYDPQEFASPVKTTGVKFSEGTLRANYTTSITALVDLNYIMAQDSYLTLFGEIVTYAFLGESTYLEDVTDNANIDIPELVISYDWSMKTNFYYRSTLTIFDILGIAGGFVSILAFTSRILVTFVAERMYYFSMISNLYQVDASKLHPDLHSHHSDADLAKYSKS